MKILFLGDVVGEPGRMAACRTAELYLERGDADFIIANGENAAAGRGITPKLAIDLMRSGVAVITSGDHIWDQKEILSYIATEPRLLRPINYPSGTPGGGSIVLDTAHGPIAVMNVQCRTFMKNPLENPFLAASSEVERLRKETAVIVVDVHGETTSEKSPWGDTLTVWSHLSLEPIPTCRPRMNGSCPRAPDFSAMQGLSLIHISEPTRPY